MAGYVINRVERHPYEFHIDTPDVADKIRKVAYNPRVITLQLDGDELEAALWGLEHYVKPRGAA